jgi:predicted RNase H-like HicB family nuclease
MSRYHYVIERAPHNLAAYVPDLPGCVATAATEDELLRAITKAITWHIEGLIEDGVTVPPPEYAGGIPIEVGESAGGFHA